MLQHNLKSEENLVYEKYGKPDVVQQKTIQEPTPKEHEVLIKVVATAVSAGNTRMRSFNFPLTFWLPARLMLGLWKPKNPILGMEMAGEVEAVGSKVNMFKKGDLVFNE